MTLATINTTATSMKMSRPRKHHQLNRFLSKTFHMVTNSDPSIIVWASTGDSFLIKRVDDFSKEILPKYFKHSKFTSFVRQLNFYGFRKIRPDASVLNEEEVLVSNAVRFYHEHFQANKPELLHKINRATKTTEPIPMDQMESLQAEMAELRDRLHTMTDEMDSKINKAIQAMELEHRQRLLHLEAAFHEVVSSLLLKDRILPSPTSTLPTPILSPPASSIPASLQLSHLLAASRTAQQQLPPKTSIISSRVESPPLSMARASEG